MSKVIRLNEETIKLLENARMLHRQYEIENCNSTYLNDIYKEDINLFIQRLCKQYIEDYNI